MVEASTDFPLSFACGIIEELQHQFQERFADLHAKADELDSFKFHLKWMQLHVQTVYN